MGSECCLHVAGQDRRNICTYHLDQYRYYLVAISRSIQSPRTFIVRPSLSATILPFSPNLRDRPWNTDDHCSCVWGYKGTTVQSSCKHNALYSFFFFKILTPYLYHQNVVATYVIIILYIILFCGFILYERFYLGKKTHFISKLDVDFVSDAVWRPGEREKILAQDHKDSVDKLSSMKSALLSVMTPKFSQAPA